MRPARRDTDLFGKRDWSNNVMITIGIIAVFALVAVSAAHGSHQ
jgi:hypothetical protein